MISLKFTFPFASFFTVSTSVPVSSFNTKLNWSACKSAPVNSFDTEICAVPVAVYVYVLVNVLLLILLPEYLTFADKVPNIPFVTLTVTFFADESYV